MKNFKADKNNYITQQGYEKLVANFNDLKLNQRPEVLKVIAWAASLGDRSENADYQYAKKKLREIDKQLGKIGRSLDHSVVVPSAIYDDKVIRFGAYVLLSDENGDEKKIKIVGTDEIEIEKGKISWLSPLGKVLISKKVDEDVFFETPSGTKYYSIVDVWYEED